MRGHACHQVTVRRYECLREDRDVLEDDGVAEDGEVVEDDIFAESPAAAAERVRRFQLIKELLTAPALGTSPPRCRHGGERRQDQARQARPIAPPPSVHGTARRGPRDRTTSLDAAALATAPASTASRASLAAGTAGAAPAALEQHGRSRRAHGPDRPEFEGNLGAWNKKLDRASLRPGTRAGWCG